MPKKKLTLVVDTKDPFKPYIGFDNSKGETYIALVSIFEDDMLINAAWIEETPEKIELADSIPHVLTKTDRVKKGMFNNTYRMYQISN